VPWRKTPVSATLPCAGHPRDRAPTIYFSDRPERIVGRITTHRFLQRWFEGDDSFADPSNAVIGWGEPRTKIPEEAVVVISDPAVTARAALCGPVRRHRCRSA